MTQGTPESAGTRSTKGSSRTGGASSSTLRKGETAGEAPESAVRSAATDRSGAPIRRLRLNLARVDPWSVMKLSFLASIGVGIAIVVATIVIWNVVDAMGLFDAIAELANQLTAGSTEPFSFLEFFELRNMLSISVVIAVVDVVLLTALGTLSAFLYNIVAALLGGLNVTFTDE
jgi:hypothetical protein